MKTKTCKKCDGEFIALGRKVVCWKCDSRFITKTRMLYLALKGRRVIEKVRAF